ncbi:hypothetical protein BDW74DRAFT_170141 [Aspergillus multicolor]|uniref:C2H2-type zinc finger protein n=1 Tax=Aspergillus multicolor TaxID=41759 RepID=UPI003CCD2B51
MVPPRSVQKAGTAHRPFKCHCGRSYTKLEHLNVHTNLKPYCCEQCGRTFGRQDVLSRHVKLHDDSVPRQSLTAALPITLSTPQDACALGQQSDETLPEVTSLAFPDAAPPTPPNDGGTHTSLDDSNGLFEWLMSGFNDNAILPLPLVSGPGMDSASIPPDSTLGGSLNDQNSCAGQDTTRIQQLFRMINDLSGGLNSNIKSNDITAGFLDACLNEYFNRLSPVLPLVLTALLGQMHALLSSNSDTQMTASEVQRRAILGHYVLDELISQSSGAPPSVRHLTNCIQTTCSDSVFVLPTVDEWLNGMACSATQQKPVSSIFAKLLDRQYPCPSLHISGISVAIVIEGLQSLISEATGLSTDTDSPCFGVVNRQQIVHALLKLHRTQLSQLYQLSPSPSAPMAIGMTNVTSTQSVDLDQWISGADSARALLHANAVMRLLQRVTLADSLAPPIPMAIFSAAMVLTALCLSGRYRYLPPRDPNWDDSLRQPGHPQHQGCSQFGDLQSHLTVDVSLVDELNFHQLTLRTTTSCWGVSAQMERILAHFNALIRQRIVLGRALTLRLRCIEWLSASFRK